MPLFLLRKIVPALAVLVFASTGLAAVPFPCEAYLRNGDALTMATEVFYNKKTMSPKAPPAEAVKAYKMMAADYLKHALSIAKTNAEAVQSRGIIKLSGKFDPIHLVNRIADATLYEIAYRLMSQEQPDIKELAKFYADETPNAGELSDPIISFSDLISKEDQDWASLETMLALQPYIPDGGILSVRNQEWRAFYSLLYAPEDKSVDRHVWELRRRLYAIFTFNAHWGILKKEIQSVAGTDDIYDVVLDSVIKQRRFLQKEFLAELMLYASQE